ncbi:hypothetical protein Patl1_12213 [Pistacia atlantica]|uniref:Uncharacterized protein n=1 Tax=Pistacia atlantica TaxID=434234 RepID=A0ACC1A9C3_9ROSI|nr:hypothetical protein Patl1_12213 [Pistacia atlantica]
MICNSTSLSTQKTAASNLQFQSPQNLYSATLNEVLDNGCLNPVYLYLSQSLNQALLLNKHTYPLHKSIKSMPNKQYVLHKFIKSDDHKGVTPFL